MLNILFISVLVFLYVTSILGIIGAGALANQKNPIMGMFTVLFMAFLLTICPILILYIHSL